MVDEGVDITDRFPIPARGVPVLCGLSFDVEHPIPLIYFGRETRETGRLIPESPEPTRTAEASSRRTSNNPLNSIIRKWEAQFAMQGGVMESSDFVSTKGRKDDRYYQADEWLDDGEEQDATDNGEYIGEVDLDAFRVLIPGEDREDGLEDEDEEGDSDGTDQENEGDDDVLGDVGGNWQLLLKRLDSSRQQIIKDLVIDLETFQSFPGHTKQKKQKHLRDSAARLRRLLPKINQVQNQWQAAVWNVVVSTNDAVNMQAFMELWNDLAPSKQKEEIVGERTELLEKLREAIPEVVTAYKGGEALMRNKFEPTFNILTKLWELWVHEEECAGRVTPNPSPARSATKTEKRFASVISESIPEIESLDYFVALMLRVSLFGSKGVGAKKAVTSTLLPEGSEDEPNEASGGTGGSLVVSLPLNVYIYRKNELLKCKLLEIKSLSNQVIQITDKEWLKDNESSTSFEFQSFDSLFESYQQKYVRKQDRVNLVSTYDAWKYFAIRHPSIPSEYVTLFDLAQKASGLLHFAFTDKSGYPVFVPPLAAARSADAEKKKRQDQIKEERKRKRELIEAKAKEQSMKNPPFNLEFIPIPKFDRDLFALNRPVIDLNDFDVGTTASAPIVADSSN